MKTRLFGLFALVMVLSLVLASVVSAQSPQPPVITDFDRRPTGQTYLDQVGDDAMRFVRRGSIAPRPGSESATAPAVAIGQPGLSFRHVKTFGVSEEAYPADAAYLNQPTGLHVDGAGNVYLVEESGNRMLKYSPTGAHLLTVGKAGMWDPWNQDQYFLAWPKDVTLDGSGNIWVVDNHRVTQFDSDGNYLQVFPTRDKDPMGCGTDNEHFCEPRGIAFDHAGQMFVSDRGNHRVQVFEMTSGAPVYSTTIGMTGEAGADNTHLNAPGQVVVDSAGLLYVVDSSNYRVQRCSSESGSWTCATFHGTGSEGSGPNELGLTYGLGIDVADNIYIADYGNSRVKKCSSTGTYVILATALYAPYDVAIAPDGNAYVSDPDNVTVHKYSSSGVLLGVFAGTSGVPYLPDTTRINAPDGVATTSDGGFVVVENSGCRVVKFDASGAQAWVLGEAARWGNDNAHLGGPEGNPAVDASGRIYVSDTGNNRIQVLSGGGAYLFSFGGWGNGPGEFECPVGVAISPLSGDVFVSDTCNQRVQVFTSSLVYKAAIGVLDEPGSDNAHFSSPRGVAVDTLGRAYVVDAGNTRVQRCTLSGPGYICTTFAGVTGEGGDDFAHLACPTSVAVDGTDRVYVADDCNQRVQVFDSTGAYLTGMGGYGHDPGRMFGPFGVAVDAAGNLYEADRWTHRVQQFAPGVPGWRQLNINGFGDIANHVAHRMSVFGGRLYASTWNGATGGEVWRTSNGTDWAQVSVDGFGDPDNYSALVGEAFNGHLYVGTQNRADGGDVWRCAACDGSDWTRVVAGGFGDPANVSIERLVVFGGQLYATTINDTTGAEVWRSPSGNSGTWTQVNVDGFGDAANWGVWAVAIHNGSLYAVAGQWPPVTAGAEVWRCTQCDGSDWTQVNEDGFGSVENGSPWAETFEGKLYVGSSNPAGAQVRRCTICDGSDWEIVTTNGFGDQNNARVDFMIADGHRFYLALTNESTGAEVWQTGDGVHWNQANPDGFGDSHNQSAWGGAVFSGRLFLGTLNYANGGEVWQLLESRYLPMIMR